MPLREIFAMEQGVGAPHHVEKYPETWAVIGIVWHLPDPFLGAQAPCLLTVSSAFSGVLHIHEQEIHADAVRKLWSEHTRHLHQHSHTACTVVGAVDGGAVHRFIRIAVGPRACVVMCQQQHTVVCRAVYLCEDVFCGKFFPFECGYRGGLYHSGVHSALVHVTGDKLNASAVCG